jgi:hypothetical protein
MALFHATAVAVSAFFSCVRPALDGRAKAGGAAIHGPFVIMQAPSIVLGPAPSIVAASRFLFSFLFFPGR